MLRTVAVCSLWTESALGRTRIGICTGATGVTVLAVWAGVPSCAGLASRGVVMAGAARRVVLPLEVYKWFIKEESSATAGRGSVDDCENNGDRGEECACKADHIHCVVKKNRVV